MTPKNVTTLRLTETNRGFFGHFQLRTAADVRPLQPVAAQQPPPPPPPGSRCCGAEAGSWWGRARTLVMLPSSDS